MKFLALLFFGLILIISGCHSIQPSNPLPTQKPITKVDKEITSHKTTATDGSTDTADEDHGENHQELTGGTLSTVPTWVVAFVWHDVDGKLAWCLSNPKHSDCEGHIHLCSASVLSQHYLLTAAHCAANTTTDGYKDVSIIRANSVGTSQTIYTGRAKFLVHPDYDHDALFLDPEDDIALFRLRSGEVNLFLTERARIYIDYVNPIWTRAEPQPFTFAGWGLTDLSSNAECTKGTSGVLRVGNATGLRPASRDQKDMTATQGTTHLCPGDSGSPWLFPRAGDFLAFAVTSGWQFEFGGNVDKGTSIFPKFDWIYDVSREPGCNSLECYETFLDCKLAGTTSDDDHLPFHYCFETKRVTGRPPDPGTACPSGKHCCDPGTDKCNQCIPNNKECP